MNKAMILNLVMGVAWFSGGLGVSLCEEKNFKDCLVLMTRNLAISQKLEVLKFLIFKC